MKQQSLHEIPDLYSGEWNIICDFDGTITPFDVTDAILGEFAAPAWEDIEEDWLRGDITARECMARQIALIRAPVRVLDAFLDSVPVTAGFPEFVRFCRSRNLRAFVVSDGMDYAIKRILARHGLTGIPVIANRLRHNGNDTYSLDFPYGADGCPSGVCKCAVARAEAGKCLLVGDGRSDCCLAGAVSFVLAKQGKDLQRHCEANGYPHREYGDFFDVMGLLEAGPEQDGAFPSRNFSVARSA